ncbi:hypothetical protein [Paraburkholderia terrae]
MKYIPKLIFAAGIAVLGYSIYAHATAPLGWDGAATDATTSTAIGLLIASIAAEYLFCRTAA